MRGRKPRPSHLKLLDGNPGHRPLNRLEPKPEMALPRPPGFLAGIALQEWHEMCAELSRMGVLARIDKAALAGYCQSYGRWIDAEEKLAEMRATLPESRGLFIATKAGNIIQNPVLAIANRAMSDMVRYAAEFGMTPSARARISTPEAQGANPMGLLLNLPPKRA